MGVRLFKHSLLSCLTLLSLDSTTTSSLYSFTITMARKLHSTRGSYAPEDTTAPPRRKQKGKSPRAKPIQPDATTTVQPKTLRLKPVAVPPKKNNRCCLAIAVISTLVVIIFATIAFIAYRAYNTDVDYKGEFECKPTRGYGNVAEYDDPEPEIKEKLSTRVKRGVWKGFKICTFPLWVFPFLFVKSSKFRSTLFFGGSLLFMFRDPGSFFAWGLWAIISLAAAQWAIQKYIFGPPPF